MLIYGLHLKESLDSKTSVPQLGSVRTLHTKRQLIDILNYTVI